MQLFEFAVCGSEKTSLTQAQGIVRVQSIAINQSLFVLQNCLRALSFAAKRNANGSSHQTLAHVPLRDSALTKLLAHSLGGKSG